MTVVDSHHHFWDLSLRAYDWMPEGSPLRINYGPDELRPLLDEAGVDKTVIVQAHASVEETEWCLEIAKDTDFVAGVVGWVDLSAPDVGHTLDRLQENPYFKGVRHLWEMDEDHGWLAGDAPIRRTERDRTTRSVLRLLSSTLESAVCSSHHGARPGSKSRNRSHREAEYQGTGN